MKYLWGISHDLVLWPKLNVYYLGECSMGAWVECVFWFCWVQCWDISVRSLQSAVLFTSVAFLLIRLDVLLLKMGIKIPRYYLLLWYALISFPISFAYLLEIISFWLPWGLPKASYGNSNLIYAADILTPITYKNSTFLFLPYFMLLLSYFAHF